MLNDFDRIRVRPNPDDQRLTVNLTGIDHTGAAVATRVPVERSLTLFLNGQEIVTAMTIGDYPEDLAVGYFLNQGMLRPEDAITGIDYDEELAVVVVRTERKTNYEEKLKKKTQTSGCAQGTAFGDLMDVIEGIRSAASRTAHLLAVPADQRDQHDAVTVSGGRCDPRGGAVLPGRTAGVYGGRRPAQRRGQDRGPHAPPWHHGRATRSSIRPDG